jgi:hypothetical protein
MLVAKPAIAIHSDHMAKVSNKTAYGGKGCKRFAEPKALGVTKDGVRILKPKGKATHFTPKELRDAVAAARASKRA